MGQRAVHGSRFQLKHIGALDNLNDIPGDVICGSCLPQERAAAMSKDLIHRELSGDEMPTDVQ